MPIYTFNNTHPRTYTLIHAYTHMHTYTHTHTHTHIHACSHTQNSTMRCLCTLQTSPNLSLETKKKSLSGPLRVSPDNEKQHPISRPKSSAITRKDEPGTWLWTAPHSVKPPVFTAPAPTPSRVSMFSHVCWACWKMVLQRFWDRVLLGTRLAGQGLWILFWVQGSHQGLLVWGIAIYPFTLPHDLDPVYLESWVPREWSFLGIKRSKKQRLVWVSHLQALGSTAPLHRGSEADRATGPRNLPPTAGREFHHLSQQAGPLERDVSCSLMSKFCDPTDCSPPGSSVYGILQERILEWVAISFSRKSSRPRDWTWISCIAGRLFTVWVSFKGGISQIYTNKLPFMTWKVMEELLPARYMPGAVAERDNMSETGWQLPL